MIRFIAVSVSPGAPIFGPHPDRVNPFAVRWIGRHRLARKAKAALADDPVQRHAGGGGVPRRAPVIHRVHEVVPEKALYVAFIISGELNDALGYAHVDVDWVVRRP